MIVLKINYMSNSMIKTITRKCEMTINCINKLMQLISNLNNNCVIVDYNFKHFNLIEIQVYFDEKKYEINITSLNQLLRKDKNVLAFQSIDALLEYLQCTFNK